jgi:hypothetical protein
MSSDCAHALNNLRRKLCSRDNSRAWLGKGKDSNIIVNKQSLITDPRVREYTVAKHCPS